MKEMQLIMESWRGYQRQVLLEDFKAWSAPNILTEEVYLLEEGKVVDFIKTGFELALNKIPKKFIAMVERGEALGVEKQKEALLALSQSPQFQEDIKKLASRFNALKPETIDKWATISESAAALSSEAQKSTILMNKMLQYQEENIALRVQNREKDALIKRLRAQTGDTSTTAQIEAAEETAKKNNPEVKVDPTTKEFLKHIAKASAGKFIFGFIDNFIMVCVGAWLDKTIGAGLGLSAMAAAGVGNGISDAVADVGESSINQTLAKIGLAPEDIKLADEAAGWKRWLNKRYSPIAIFLGCMVGMFPLITGVGPAMLGLGAALGGVRIGGKIYQKRKAAAKAAAKAEKAFRTAPTAKLSPAME